MRYFLFFFLTLVSFTSFKTQTIIGDTNADGCVNLDDILSVLGTYGQCLDECGVPNGDNSTCTDCCGIVNGDGSTCDGPCGPCGEEIPDDACDCDGNQLDAIGVCGGECTADENLNGICDDSETPATLECQSCGYYDLDSSGEYTVWNAGSPSNQSDFQHKVLDWDGGHTANSFQRPQYSDLDQDLIFDCYEMGAIVDESVPTKDRSGGVINFNGVNNDAALIASTSCQDPQGSLYTKLTDVDFTGNLPDNNQFWDANPGDVIHKCIKTCALSTSLPQYPVGVNGSTTFSPQKWDFAISRSQNNTNNIINPSITEGDRRFVFRYHSGRAKDQSSSDTGFDNIIFEYKEWIYTTSWPYPNTPTNTSNWFGWGGDGGGWMEVDGYDASGTPQTPEFPVPAGECKLGYAYNKNPSSPNNTSWVANYNSTNPPMKSLYEVTHGICVGGEPTYSEGNLPNLYIESCQLDSNP